MLDGTNLESQLAHHLLMRLLYDVFPCRGHWRLTWWGKFEPKLRNWTSHFVRHTQSLSWILWRALGRYLIFSHVMALKAEFTSISMIFRAPRPRQETQSVFFTSLTCTQRDSVSTTRVIFSRFHHFSRQHSLAFQVQASSPYRRGLTDVLMTRCADD